MKANCIICGVEFIPRKMAKSKYFTKTCSPSCSRKRRTPLNRKGWKHSLEAVQKISAANSINYKKTKNREKHFYKCLKNLPENMPGITHQSCKIWKVRSPDNKVYIFKNMRVFVESHAHLFDSEDLIKRCRNISRAESGLSALRPGNRKKVQGSWKGWTWISQIEEDIGNQDILQRQTTS